MKIKRFIETLKEPQINDFVIIEYKNEIIYNIGKITIFVKNSSFQYFVEFDEDFNYYEYGLDDSSLAIAREEIKYWSKNREELEQILLNNKFNI